MRILCGTILVAMAAFAVSLDAIGGPRDQYICYRSFRPQLERTKERVGTDPAERAFSRAFRDFNPLNDLGSG